ncbi:protein of unknown function [Mariniphaga anaerophila]|uniref:DUF4434 domain-containing protein n=1 Tax=Mariniphaga anaerophila TaxID=1484053 RepID=A0A1M5F8S4_9BACT|nr:DUF4434 domain-containing protein [Mariniphaga anaerophila]SHF88020.1 protein of unknown function [Mariniphaga anaerophila]
MKFKFIFFITLLFSLSNCGCKKDVSVNEDEKVEVGVDELLSQTAATKFLNHFDYDCVCYIPTLEHSSVIDVDATFDFDEKIQGFASLKCEYTFPGKSGSGSPETFSVKKVWGTYRSDLSFYPLGISLQVKSATGNKDKLRITLLVQNKAFTLSTDDLMTYSYTDESILNGDGWQRLVIPYSYFQPEKEQFGDLELNRVTGYLITIENGTSEPHTASVHFDAFEQLTSFKPELKKTARFSSIFIQLHAPVNLTTDWESTFYSYQEVGIDTMIIQHATRNREGQGIFHYKGSKLPWMKEEYSWINDMFTAAEKTGMKLIVGLNGGGYPVDKGYAPAYDELLERNKEIIDELYEKFSDSEAMAGWYITEEFHDGVSKGWWKYEDRMLLAHYNQRVAAYAKSKPKKFIVTIAPALWRGRPADMTYGFYKTFFEKTPDIDVLYLQDCGGRCCVDDGDFDVDLPNYYKQIKKACDETGVRFGVDIESFERCSCEGIGYHAKSWAELKDQLDMAGLFTENITQFSWTTFRPGVGAFDEYKKYLQEQGLID